jgi:cytoskeletal protein RodZ
MLEYRKTTFLLESSNNKTAEEKKEMTWNIENLKEKVRNQELINLMLVIIFSIMLIVVFFVWFANV